MTYTVQSLIVCDDVRAEVNGKQMLIGVYLDEIIAKSFPFNTPQIVFRFAVKLGGQAYDSVSVSVKSRDGHVLLETTAEARLKADDEGAAFVFGVRGAKFAKADIYDVSFGLGEAAKKVGEFVVRLPKNAEETQRLTAI